MTKPTKTGLAGAAVMNRAQFLKLLGGSAFATMTGSFGLTTAALAEGGDLVVGISSDIKTLDPQMSPLDVFRHTIRSTVFEALVFINPETLSADPMLADSWQKSDDGLTWTFNLKSGVTWHNGSPFTAADVVYSITRVQDAKVGSPFAPQLTAISKAEAKDDKTVVLTLAHTVPGLLANLAVIQIVNEASIGTITTAPVGTGPFKFANWAPGDRIRVEKYDGHRDPPKVAAIEWRIVPDSQARLAGLQDGSLQMVALVEGKDVIQAQSSAGIEVIQTKPYVLYENFNINTKRAPFDDKRVRQALAFAFDRAAYTKSIWFGFARPTINPVPPEMATYLPGSAEQYPFDLDKAAALLAEAGFSKDKPLTMEILTPTGFDSLKSMALVLQDNLNRIGHKVTVRELEITVWIDRILTKPDYDLTTNNYNTGPEDPASMFNSPNLAPTANVSLWNPPGYADLVGKAAAEIDPKKQVELYQELQKLLLEEMPQITIDHLPLFFLGSEATKSLVIGPSGIDDYKKIAL
ncbi:ABC transporter substrate-binding protein [Aestuariivirga sp. YIM B02566]|uniref:ABC transporter substrate-binding protein n=1 Tax=Taklimakanibacter albus TaxID=2800327 RepID=A0ACC5RAJ6_9HYPH|nr:ABC transporter substrate-binding protein [Aestuariivirga sp. YIM B02566]